MGIAVPSAEVKVDRHLVRDLVARDFPEWAGVEPLFVDEGWDASVWRLGQNRVARVARRAAGAALLAHEIQWAGEVAAELELEWPGPWRRGRPGAGHPWAWGLGHWVDGTPGDQAVPGQGDGTRLGRALAAMHRVAPTDAPRSRVRGVALAERLSHPVARAAVESASLRVRRALERAADVQPFVGPPRWLHGDLHPANLIWRDGNLVGIIDFGDLGAGDPACDLAGCFLAFEGEELEASLEAYRADRPLRQRAAGWALLFAEIFEGVEIARPTYGPIARRARRAALGALEG